MIAFKVSIWQVLRGILQLRKGNNMRKMFIFTLAVLILSMKPAFAQNFTISQLLADGYEIVAAAYDDTRTNAAFVFLQKRTQAYMCIVNPTASRCFNLNEHTKIN